MNTEIASFFDNSDLALKSSSLWQSLNQDIYNNDNIIFQQDCYKISKNQKQQTNNNQTWK